MLTNNDPTTRLKANALYMQQSRREALASSLRRTTAASARSLVLWSLVPLSLLVTGCASQSIQPCEPLKQTPMPAQTKPSPSQSYLVNVNQLFLRWEKMLTNGSANTN